MSESAQSPAAAPEAGAEGALATDPAQPKRRGPYRKGVERRRQILDAALEVIDREGYSGATIKALADAVGLSQNGLLHYFGSKDELFTAVLRRRDEVLYATIGREPEDLAQDLPARLRETAAWPQEVPGLLELEFQLYLEATRPEHPAYGFFRDRGDAVHDILASGLARLRDEGRAPEELDPDSTSTLLLAAVDGLHLRWFYNRDLDVAGLLDELLRSLGLEEPLIPGRD